MALKVETNLNLSKHELQNAVVQNLTAHPSGPVDGLIYYNTTDNEFYGYKNGSWSVLGSGSVTLAGDVSGSSDSNTVDTVGGKTAAAIAGAVDDSHTQNTDTGTDATSFQLDNGSSGNRVKTSGSEMQFRNGADNAYASGHMQNLTAEGDVTVNGDLTVNGTTTTINTDTVETGDNEILLNSEIATAAGNTDGGLALKRLDADNTTRRDARVTFDESSDRWEVTHGPHTAATVTHAVALKHSAVIGDGAATQYTITHNLNSLDVVVNVMENSGNYATVLVDVERTSVNAVRVTFVSAPASNAYRVIIIG